MNNNNNQSTLHTPRSTSFVPIIGMEVHAELKTASKMFCGCKNDPFHAPQPNVYTCPTCLGMPGGLPVANKKAVEWVIKLGLALGCEINLFSKFDRKNYFYPDLAKGYQISQYDIPFCVNGVLETEEGPVRIRRIHLEEDTGKLQHRTIDGQKVSLIDYNRGGVPLVEIVTEPDIHSAAHAKAYGKKLRQILRYLDISDCDMEQGSMRLEANISLSDSRMWKVENGESGKMIYTPHSTFHLPEYKVEVKNINSFSFLAKAIDFEIKRHAALLDNSETPTQETRGWDEDHNQTFSQRTKEDAADYRYFPDPDLPPIQFTEAQIKQWKDALPELPDSIVHRWQATWQMKENDCLVLTEEPDTAKTAEALFSAAHLKELDVAKLASMIVNKKIAVSLTDPHDSIFTAFSQATAVATVDAGELESAVKTVLTENPKAVADYNAGKVQLIGFFMGQVMKKLGKKVDPQVVQKTLIEGIH